LKHSLKAGISNNENALASIKLLFIARRCSRPWHISYGGGGLYKGHRGDYGPFYEASEELSRRGVFNDREVTYVRQAAKPKVTERVTRDEYKLPFPDNKYTHCKYQIDGDFITLVNEEFDGLFVEQFELINRGVRIDLTGTCSFELRLGGRYARVHVEGKGGNQIRLRIVRIGQ